MLRILLAAMAIATFFCTSTNADDLGNQIKAQVKAKIAAKLGTKVDLSGPRTINNVNNVEGEDNAVNASADGSQNLSITYREGDITYAPTDSRQWHTTTTDSRQWHTATTTTDSRQWHSPTTVQPNCTPRVVAVQPYCPPAQRYVAPRLTYSAVTDDCGDTISIRCWSKCGGYFVDTEGRRWNLLASYSQVPSSSRHMTLKGRYWRNTSGVLMFTAIWPCGTTRTFIDP
jgi:hypothetical protein